jgi:hypothetical protein
MGRGILGSVQKFGGWQNSDSRIQDLGLNFNDLSSKSDEFNEKQPDWKIQTWPNPPNFLTLLGAEK